MKIIFGVYKVAHSSPWIFHSVNWLCKYIPSYRPGTTCQCVCPLTLTHTVRRLHCTVWKHNPVPRLYCMSDTYPQSSGLWWSSASSAFTLLTRLRLYVWVNKHLLLHQRSNSTQLCGISPALCAATVPYASPSPTNTHISTHALCEAMIFPLLNRQIGPVITTERYINRAADFCT